MDTVYWKPPTVLPFNDCYEIRDLVCVGDHIAVLNPNGFWHHGIYVKHGLVSMVVGVWEETSHVTWRKFSQFASDGTRFALIEYADGAALSHTDTASLALYLCEATTESVNIPLNNSIHFATLCRTLCWEQAQAQSITQCLESLPEKQVIPIKRGFK